MLVKYKIKHTAEPDFKKKNHFQPNLQSVFSQLRTWKVHCGHVLGANSSLRFFLRYPCSDLFSAQHHYCLKIKIHGSHPLHTCDRFSALLQRWERYGLTNDHKVTFICNGEKEGVRCKEKGGMVERGKGSTRKNMEGNVSVYSGGEEGKGEGREHV